MLFWMYQLLLLIALIPALIIFLLVPRGRSYLLERLGCGAMLSLQPPVVWMHGASLGEVRGLVPLATQLKRQYPDYKILLTSSSSTGRDLQEFPADERRLLPFDFLPLYVNMFRHVKELPKLLLFAETELWPGMLYFSRSRHISTVLVNGVISDSTQAAYRLLLPLLKNEVSQLQLVCASDVRSAERLEGLGVVPERLVHTGNTKYDSLISTDVPAALAQHDAIVFASIHPQEWQTLKTLVVSIAQQVPPLRIVVAPRHIEKRRFFERALTEAGLPYSLLSEQQDATGLVLVDTVGDLPALISRAKIVVLGGTFFPLGGHNPFEAASQGVPICVGPYTHKIRDQMEALRSAQAVLEIEDGAAGAASVLELLHDSSRLSEIGDRALRVSEQFRGASARVIEALGERRIL